MDVRVFVGKKDDIWGLYYSLLYKKMEVSICDRIEGTQLSEITVDSRDYITAVSSGLTYATKADIKNVAWVSPDGSFKTVNKTACEKICEIERKDNFAVFSGNMVGVCKNETARIKEYLNIAGIKAKNTLSDDGVWQVVVKSRDYYNALFIGAKFVDGHDYRSINWNSPVNESVIGTKHIAYIARTELDNILEA